MKESVQVGALLIAVDVAVLAFVLWLGVGYN